jgi:hypothetical protein
MSCGSRKSRPSDERKGKEKEEKEEDFRQRTFKTAVSTLSHLLTNSRIAYRV